MSDPTPADQQVLDDLASALRYQADVEERHRLAAQAAFSWRTIDEELMELSYDSLGSPSAVRSVTSEARALSFTSSTGSLELEVAGDRLLGHVHPGAIVTVVMSGSDGRRVEARSDEDGMFELSFEPAEVPSGPVRFTVEGALTGTTGWVVL